MAKILVSQWLRGDKLGLLAGLAGSVEGAVYQSSRSVALMAGWQSARGGWARDFCACSGGRAIAWR